MHHTISRSVACAQSLVQGQEKKKDLVCRMGIEKFRKTTITECDYP